MQLSSESPENILPPSSVFPPLSSIRVWDVTESTQIAVIPVQVVSFSYLGPPFWYSMKRHIPPSPVKSR